MQFFRTIIAVLYIIVGDCVQKADVSEGTPRGAKLEINNRKS